MEKKLADAYNEVRVNNSVKKMILEGKSPEDVEKFLKEAGLWDRMKANANSAIQKVKNAPNTVSGYAKQGAANLAQKGVNAVSTGLNKAGIKADVSQANQNIQNLKQTGQNQVQKGQQDANDAKINSIFQSHSQDITNLMNAIVKDLDKLGIPHPGITPKSAGNLLYMLKKALFPVQSTPVGNQQPPANVATTTPTPVGTAPTAPAVPPTSV